MASFFSLRSSWTKISLDHSALATDAEGYGSHCVRDYRLFCNLRAKNLARVCESTPQLLCLYPVNKNRFVERKSSGEAAEIGAERRTNPSLLAFWNRDTILDPIPFSDALKLLGRLTTSYRC
jgi:hypothetical protein